MKDHLLNTDRMNSPYFSILLPTKNRPEYLDDSILSVILQEFEDYELIISDNHNDQRTQIVLNKYIDHQKVKIIRPEMELAMPDNWEFAAIHATGKYVIVLPDRKLFYKEALKTIYKNLKAFNEPNACSWTVKVYDDQNKKMGWFAPEIKTGKSKLFNSCTLINNFLSEKYLGSKSLDFYYPKSLNGCFKNEIAQQVRKNTGHFFNNEFATTPDYSSLFIQLACSNEVLFIGKPIYISQGEIVSNGRFSTFVDCMPYLQSLRFENYYKYVPIKAPYIYNLLLNDFLRIKDIVGGNLNKHKTDWINYFASIYFDYTKIESMGLMEHDNLLNYRNSYEEALSKLSDDEKKKIDERYEVIAHSFEKYEVSRIKKMKLHIRDFINHNFSNYTIVNKIMKHKFNSALEAAGFKKP